MSLRLGDNSLQSTRKSIKSLKTHFEPQEHHNEAIYLIINTVQPFVKVKEYTPKVITLTHKLDKLDNKLVLLITKDPSTPYRAELTRKGSPTEDVFNEIMTVTKLRKIAGNHNKLTKLFKEFDIIVADFRVRKFLPLILGPQFYVKNRKVPFLIQMAKPDINATLVKTAKSPKLKDERCDAKFVKGQLNSIARNTFVILPKGTSMAIKIGYLHWSDQQLIENIDNVIGFIIPAIVRTPKLLHNVQIKTSESISLPVYEQQPLSESDSDNELDIK